MGSVVRSWLRRPLETPTRSVCRFDFVQVFISEAAIVRDLYKRQYEQRFSGKREPPPVSHAFRVGHQHRGERYESASIYRSHGKFMSCATITSNSDGTPLMLRQ